MSLKKPSITYVSLLLFLAIWGFGWTTTNETVSVCALAVYVLLRHYGGVGVLSWRPPADIHANKVASRTCMTLHKDGRENLSLRMLCNILSLGPWVLDYTRSYSVDCAELIQNYDYYYYYCRCCRQKYYYY